MNEFVIASTITYRPHRIPPRCRVARPVDESFMHFIHIPSVASEQAPVVALVPNNNGRLAAPDGGDAPLRAYDGRLYAVRTRGQNANTPAVKAGSDQFPATDKHRSRSDSRQDAIEAAELEYRDYLIVDGDVWRATPEPAYLLSSLGIGGNAGGTYLEIDVAGRPEGRRFSLLEYETALAEAVAFAERRGDTQSIPYIRQMKPATIVDPAALKAPTRVDAVAAAEESIRAALANATALLAGTATHRTLGEAKALIEEADALLWQHGLESVA